MSSENLLESSNTSIPASTTGSESIIGVFATLNFLFLSGLIFWVLSPYINDVNQLGLIFFLPLAFVLSLIFIVLSQINLSTHKGKKGLLRIGLYGNAFGLTYLIFLFSFGPLNATIMISLALIGFLVKKWGN